MSKILDYILNRGKESSTWRGLILIATALGVQLEPDQVAAIVSAGLSVVGLVNVFRKSPVSPDVK